MNYVFIDLGAYNGDSVKWFRQRKNLPVPANQFEIYAFEPNPKYFDDLAKLDIDHVSTAAAWIKEDTLDFYVDNNKLAYGSTLYESKKAEKSTKIQVKTFDFIDWIKRFKDDYLIVKMDIEGAEFMILDKLVSQDLDLIIDELFVEFHANKVKEFTTSDMQSLKTRLRCKWQDWAC